MRNIIFGSVISAVCFSGFGVPASAFEPPQKLEKSSAQERMKLANEFLLASNVDGAIDQLRGMFVQNPKSFSNDCELDSDQLLKVQTAWINAVQKGFEPELIKKHLVNFHAQLLSKTQLQDLIAGKNTPLGKKIVALETRADIFSEATQSLGTENARISKSQALLNKDPERRALLSEIIKYSGGVDYQVQLMLTIAKSFLISFQSQFPDALGVHSNQITESQFAELGEVFKIALEPTLLPAFQMIYESLSNDELRMYAEFRKSDLGKKEVQVAMWAWERALSDISAGIGSAFVKALKAQDT